MLNGSRGRYATLADVRVLESQLREAGYGTAVKIALAKGTDKRAVETGFTEKPLTDEEAAAWDKHVLDDRGRAVGEGCRHFLFLLEASYPPLVVLDYDDPNAALTKESLVELKESGAWLAPSASKGFHAVLVEDQASVEVTGSRGQVELKPVGKGDSVGEVHTRFVTAYKPLEQTKPTTLSDAPRLYTTLTGKTQPPSARVKEIMLDALKEMDGWERLTEGGNKRWLRFQSIIKQAARRLKTAGILPGSGIWRDCATALSNRFSEVKPDKKVSLSEVLESMNWAYSHAYNAAVGGAFDLVEAVWEEVLAEHEGELYVEPDGKSVKENWVTAWVPAERTWRRYRVGRTHIASDSTEVPAFNDLVDRKIHTVSIDSGLPAPTTVKTTQARNALWSSKEGSSYVHQDIDALFDYQAPRPRGTDRPYTPPKEVYYCCGRGDVIRIGLTKADLEAGNVVSIQPNRPEYRTKARLPYPHQEESTLLEEYLPKWFPEEGVVDYILDMVALSLLPREWHEDRFLNVVGDGWNGKSTCFEALTYALGDFGVVVPFSSIKSQSGTDIRQLGERRKMIGKRLILIDETTRDQVDESWFKNATCARSSSQVGTFYQENVQRHIDGMLMILSNVELNMSATAAARRRAAIVPANRKFGGKTQIATLGDDLQREASKILRMILNRVPLVLQRKMEEPRDFEQPAVMQARRDAWLTNQNSSRSLLATYFLQPDTALTGWLAKQSGDEAQSHDHAPLAFPASGKVEDIPLILRGQSGRNTGLAGVARIIKEAEDNTKRSPRAMVIEYLQSVGQSVGYGRSRNLSRLVPTNALVSALVEQEKSNERAPKAEAGFWSLFPPDILNQAKAVYEDALLDEIDRQSAMRETSNFVNPALGGSDEDVMTGVKE